MFCRKLFLTRRKSSPNVARLLDGACQLVDACQSDDDRGVADDDRDEDQQAAGARRRRPADE